MTIPEIHTHHGEETTNTPLGCYHKEPGEEPQWVEVGHWCAYCGFQPSPVAVKLSLEAEMGFAITEEEVEVDDGP